MLTNTANDIKTLREKFGLNREVVEELYEEIVSYYHVKPKISTLPFNDAFEEVNGRKKYCDFFKFNDVECWGLDCNILADDKLDEPFFHFRICKENNKYTLQYLYTGS